MDNSKIACRKPKPFEWVRCHPDEDKYSIILPVVVFGKEKSDDDDKRADDKEFYVISPDLMDHPDLADDATKQREFTLAATRGGKIFVWPRTFLDKENTWLDTAAQNIAAARKGWIRSISGDDQYNRRESKRDFGEPKWPERDFDSILIEALGSYWVGDESHPLFKKLAGLE